MMFIFLADSFNHEAALEIAIITQFICDTLGNSCSADQVAQDLCAKAAAAANAADPKTGKQADTFNGFFGINTSFANVKPVTN